LGHPVFFKKKNYLFIFGEKSARSKGAIAAVREERRHGEGRPPRRREVVPAAPPRGPPPKLGLSVNPADHAGEECQTLRDSGGLTWAPIFFPKNGFFHR